MIGIVNLNKKFGKLHVLKDVSVQIERGCVSAIVGPNGSGKTTLIKSILGLVKPSSGQIFVNGIQINGDCAYRQQIGYMPQVAQFPENLTVREILHLVKDLRGNPTDLNETLFDQLGLEKELDKRMRTLSGGTRQKVSATLAFLFNPKILILDEPTAGLDPVSSSILKDQIQQEKAKGKTVILTSHIMSEIEELSDNIIFLLEGTVRFEGAIKTLIAGTNQQNLERTIAHIMMQGVA
ncbi:MAG: ABC transporter ATP-binding protein [Gemmatimonadetes bacterium]|nr:MAG: ABC transporter ATP-binding protein [Gemmatimonadota bacterium]